MSELPSKRDRRVALRLSSADLARWQRVAERRGLTLSQWIRDACRDAIARGILR